MAALDFSANWLALESVLIARLTAEVDDIAEVGGAYELDTRERDGVESPGLYVLYGGDADVPSKPGYEAQTWTVRLYDKPGLSTTHTSLAAPGARLAQILRALFPKAGWKPADNVRPPKRVYGGEQPVYYAGGVVRIAIALTVEIKPEACV